MQEMKVDTWTLPSKQKKFALKRKETNAEESGNAVVGVSMHVGHSLTITIMIITQNCAGMVLESKNLKKKKSFWVKSKKVKSKWLRRRRKISFGWSVSRSSQSSSPSSSRPCPTTLVRIKF